MAKMKMGDYAIVVAGVGALNWGLDEFGYNLLNYLPEGITKWVVYAIGASGIIVLYNKFGK